jgi:hypothetical protein
MGIQKSKSPHGGGLVVVMVCHQRAALAFRLVGGIWSSFCVQSAQTWQA